jgi:hypothetical protein
MAQEDLVIEPNIPDMHDEYSPKFFPVRVESLSNLNHDDYDTFLTERRSLMSKKIKDYYEKL